MDQIPPHATPVIISAKNSDDESNFVLTDAFKKAAANAKIMTVALSEDTPEVHKSLAKRRHDIKAAIRTLGFMVAAIKTGYTFSDEKAAAKIEAIEKAVNCLNRESEILVQMLASDP